MEQLDMAKGISEYGILIVIAAVFLVFSVAMMMIFVRFFVRTVDNIIKTQQKTLSDLLDETRDQNAHLSDISEGLRDDLLSRIREFASALFDLDKEKVCHLIKKIREENHIEDKEATAKKIRTLLQRLHDERNSKFDSFKFRGKPLSNFASPLWVEKVAQVIEGEIYNKTGANNGRAYTNVSTCYGDIKYEFINNVLRGNDTKRI